jgi:hypothetical protein
VTDKVAQLEALYAELPRLDCKQLCADCCGLLAMTGLEFDRLLSARPNTHHSMARFGRDHEFVFFAGPAPDPADHETLVCPLLRDGLCTAYAVRPLICRIWHCEEGMPCPHGCVPERWLTRAEARDFQHRVDEIARS